VQRGVAVRVVSCRSSQNGVLGWATVNARSVVKSKFKQVYVACAWHEGIDNGSIARMRHHL
jgi:hypothetical protein